MLYNGSPMPTFSQPDSMLALALHGLTIEREPRRALACVRTLGFSCVQLDAAAAGLRPRDLSHSDRKDLTALLGRLELSLAGVDLWIPAEHFGDPERVDRAASAMFDAIAFASDMRQSTGGGATVCCSLPAPGVADDVVASIESSAAMQGVFVANFHWPPAAEMSDAAVTQAHALPGGAIGVGVDPAAALLAGVSPAKLCATLGQRLAGARLSDADASMRVAPGEGRLEIEAYRAALHIVGFNQPVVLDLRNVPAQSVAIARASALWRQAQPPSPAR